MEQTLVGWIEENYEDFKRLVKVGAVSTSLMFKYKVYKHYLGLSHIKRNGERIFNVAEDHMVGSDTVRRAIKQMETTL